MVAQGLFGRELSSTRQPLWRAHTKGRAQSCAWRSQTAGPTASGSLWEAGPWPARCVYRSRMFHRRASSIRPEDVGRTGDSSPYRTRGIGVAFCSARDLLPPRSQSPLMVVSVSQNVVRTQMPPSRPNPSSHEASHLGAINLAFFLMHPPPKALRGTMSMGIYDDRRDHTGDGRTRD